MWGASMTTDVTKEARLQAGIDLLMDFGGIKLSCPSCKKETECAPDCIFFKDWPVQFHELQEARKVVAQVRAILSGETEGVENG